MRKTFTELKQHLRTNLRILFAVLVTSMLCLAGQSHAQVVYNEGFDLAGPYPQNSLPFGWGQGKYGVSVDADNYWDIMNNPGGNPTIAPRTGVGMARYRSWYITAGEQSFLSSKKLDMSLMPGGGATGSFWMYRNTGAYPFRADRLTVYANTTPDLAGTPTLIGTNGGPPVTNPIPRLNTQNPVVAAGWFQVTFTVPASFAGSNSVYILILGTSEDGENIYVDDFTVTTYPDPQTYTDIPGMAIVSGQNTSTTQRGRLDQQIIACKLTVDGASSPLVLTNMKFNTNGSDNPNTDITRARLWWTGGSNAFSPATALLLGTYTPVTWMTEYTFLTAPSAIYTGLASFNQLDHGDNYFWITYDIKPLATIGNFVDADWIGFDIDGGFGAVPYVPSVVTFAGKREIGLEYCIPTYFVGTAWLNYNTNDYIHNVVSVGDNVPPPGLSNGFNTINAYAGSACPAPFPRTCRWQSHPPDYELFAAVPGKTTTYTANGTTAYPISLQVGTYGSGNAIAAWIDFNKDGIFQTTEKIAQSGALGALGIYNTTFVVPIAALPGKTRLRVREVWINYNIDPCAPATYGETEDYEVTIVPTCPLVAGFTTWMGFTNDWTDPSNWCPPKAPITANVPVVSVLIPGGPSATGYTYVRPKIVSGVSAIADTLKIVNDSLFIDAPTASSLVVRQDMRILGATSLLEVNTTFVDTAQVFNGTLNRPNDNPIRSSTRSRSWLMFTSAELQSKGIQPGDVVDSLLIHLQRKSNGNAYNNFTVKYYYTNLPSMSIGSYPLPPPQIAAAGGPWPKTIYSGTMNTASFIPAANGYGTIRLGLTPGMALNPGPNTVWASAFNRLVIEICYDNVGFPTTGANDEIAFTQTGINNYYLTTQNISAYPQAGCNMLSTDYQVVSGVSGTTGSNVLTVPSTAGIYVGQILTANDITWNNSFAVEGATVTAVGPGNTITIDLSSGWDFFFEDFYFLNTNTTLLYYRPNLTFKFSRPYIQYPITVGRHWENNGTFTSGVSRVTLNGFAGVQQNILGTSTTSFYDLDLNNNQHARLFGADVTITNNLTLINGRFKLNNRLMTLTNPALTALTRVNGFIQPETDVTANNISPFGRINWQMGNVAGTRIFPFVNAAGISVFMDYTIDSGTHDVIVSTYRTAQNNTNIPTPVVTNIFGYNPTTGWSSDGYAMVDRFYGISQGVGSITPQADFVLRYDSNVGPVGERAQIGNAAMSAQGWWNDSTRWEFPYYPSQSFNGSNAVTINNFTNFGQFNWWTIVGTSTPLPVSLLDFTATPYKDKVQLKWSTASEFNNSHFEIERTLDNEDFKFIGRRNSMGPGSNRLDYDLWDNSPVEGIQYYYLRQYDIDGRLTSYGPVSAKFSMDRFDIVTTTISSSEMGVTVVFNYDSNEPVSYRIIDMAGRLIYAKDRTPAEPGVNVIDIDAKLAKGAYQIILQNSEKMVTRKFFY